jgi:hypothetical protein
MKTGYFVLYETSDNKLSVGDICSTEACAVASIHPDEQARTYGPFSFNVDSEKDQFKRMDKLDLTNPDTMSRQLFGIHHARVE